MFALKHRCESEYQSLHSAPFLKFGNTTGTFLRIPFQMGLKGNDNNLFGNHVECSIQTIVTVEEQSS